MGRSRRSHEPSSVSKTGQSGTSSPEHRAAVSESTFSIRLRSVIFARTSARWRSVRSLTSAQVGAAQVDRNGDLSAAIREWSADLLVDASGPFQTYGDDPYRVARAAIANGAHYFDLCDNADFCQGISALDGAARAAGVCVVSGMSSVPALSSTVVDALRDGQTPLMIESADGAYLNDVDGNRLIDNYLGMGPMILGHKPKAL